MESNNRSKDLRLFSAADLKNPTHLAIKLRDAKDPLSKYLKARFADKDLQDYLDEDKSDGSSFPQEWLRQALADELNRLILSGRCLYNKRRFARVDLKDNTIKLIKENPTGRRLIQLNRLLLERAYPQEITSARSRRASLKTLNDIEIDKLLRDKLSNNPGFLDVIREIIDEIPEEISDDILFEHLKPSLTSKGVSPESVDMLFYPSVRKKLKEWQQAVFEESLKDYQRDRARDNIKKVFERLTFRGSGTRRVLSTKQESEVIAIRNDIKSTCRNIIQDSCIADTGDEGISGYRKKLIREKFPWCRNPPDRDVLLDRAARTKRAEEMRACVLAIKYSSTSRNIKEIIRKCEEGFREFKKYRKKHPSTKSILIKWIGKNKTILPR